MVRLRELLIGPVYKVTRGDVTKRLRVKTKCDYEPKIRTTWCGKTAHGSYLSISYIDGLGNIKLTCVLTGKKYEINVGVIK